MIIWMTMAMQPSWPLVQTVRGVMLTDVVTKFWGDLMSALQSKQKKAGLSLPFHQTHNQPTKSAQLTSTFSI